MVGLAGNTDIGQMVGLAGTQVLVRFLFHNLLKHKQLGFYRKLVLKEINCRYSLIGKI